MVILKRFVVWLLENTCEAVMVALILLCMVSIDRNGFHSDPYFSVARNIFSLSVAVAFMFFSTGYLLTTSITRIALSKYKWWLVPSITAMLFLIHSQILFLLSGGYTQHERLLIQTTGICIAFGSTALGSRLLQIRTTNSQITPEISRP